MISSSSILSWSIPIGLWVSRVQFFNIAIHFLIIIPTILLQGLLVFFTGISHFSNVHNTIIKLHQVFSHKITLSLIFTVFGEPGFFDSTSLIDSFFTIDTMFLYHTTIIGIFVKQVFDTSNNIINIILCNSICGVKLIKCRFDTRNFINTDVIFKISFFRIVPYN